MVLDARTDSEYLNSIRSIGRNLMVPSKEKDDEENCEYEMIFDAEGSMHLVKKATTQAPVAKSDLGSVGRCDLVIYSCFSFLSSACSRQHHGSEQHAACAVVFLSELAYGHDILYVDTMLVVCVTKTSVTDCSDYRGNVTIQQTAKKTLVQEPETSVSVDMSTAKMPPSSPSRRQGTETYWKSDLGIEIAQHHCCRECSSLHEAVV